MSYSMRETSAAAAHCRLAARPIAVGLPTCGISTMSCAAGDRRHVHAGGDPSADARVRLEDVSGFELRDQLVLRRGIDAFADGDADGERSQRRRRPASWYCGEGSSKKKMS